VTDPYRAGSVYWFEIDFERGRGDEDKYIVLLGDCLENGDKSVFAFATSQDRHYPGMGPGTPPCGPKNRAYRIDKGQEACFSKPTFVQFNNAYPITRLGLDDAVKEGRARFLHTLAEERLRGILKCAKGSVDLAKWQIALIEQKYRSLAPAKGTPPTGQRAVSSARPATPPPFVPTEILSMRVRVEARCGTCRTTLADLIPMAETEMLRILAGLAPPTAGFLENLGAGLEILGNDCSCTKR
jgi:hypothetical protein